MKAHTLLQELSDRPNLVRAISGESPYYLLPMDRLELIEAAETFCPSFNKYDIIKIIDSREFYGLLLNHVWRTNEEKYELFCLYLTMWAIEHLLLNNIKRNV